MCVCVREREREREREKENSCLFFLRERNVFVMFDKPEDKE